jgi:hypothetical protein
MNNKRKMKKKKKKRKSASSVANNITAGTVPGSWIPRTLGFFLAVLEFELRASHLLSRYTTT